MPFADYRSRQVRVKTPTLILHSDNDYRVPLEPGEQWFPALKHDGVTAELVVFPARTITRPAPANPNTCPAAGPIAFGFVALECQT